jgi:ferredoxin-NADP reductase
MSVPQKIRSRIKGITDHGDHVYTVYLKPERLLPGFRPGQFLHLALDDYDSCGFWPDSRAFSIASSPSQRSDLRISYSVKGRFTGRMERELHEGRWVWIKLPYGEFVVDSTTDVVLFAGGTGITAFAAFLEDLVPDIEHNIYLAYGARNRNLLIYRDLIDEFASRIAKLHVRYFVEDDRECKPTIAARRHPEIKGRLGAAAVLQEIRCPTETTYYVSGPPMMLKVISQELYDYGIRREAIRIDAWE